jgi:NAD(P)-dependent dehydrogenase (short-subunit alcohol dehydrogenase family)
VIWKDETRALQGRICLVTGATTGIGSVTALELARLGGDVVIVGRRSDRCLREVARVHRATGGRVVALPADLSSLGQVRGLAEAFRSRFPRLDVLVNNAGSYFFRRELSADGLEMTFALNHLGHFALTLLLMRSLRASPSARVVNVSSAAHERWTVDFDDLRCDKRYERLAAYGRSKLANLLFTYELARRLKGTRITVNALHPGSVATNLGSDGAWLRVRVRNLVKRSMLRPEDGARTSVYLATSREVEGVSGRYFNQCRQIRSSEASYDETAAARLWQVSEGLSGVSWTEACGELQHLQEVSG